MNLVQKIKNLYHQSGKYIFRQEHYIVRHLHQGQGQFDLRKVVLLPRYQPLGKIVDFLLVRQYQIFLTKASM